MTTTSSPNISPAGLATPGTTGGRPFLLSKAEWYAIQVYVTDALALPITDEAFKKSLGAGAPADLKDFVELIDCYKAINTHCNTWKKTTYPASVDLASDIVSYNLKVPTYYGAIQKEADILTEDPDNAQAQKALKAILDNLSKSAQDKADRAGAVYKQVAEFATQTEADKATLLGPDGKSGLVKKYNEKYGTTSKEVQDLTKQIADEQAIVKKATDEYNYDVTVAATTPTYAWLIPEGLIAAAVVAGVYGHRATAALDTIHAAQAKIDKMNAQLAADANLLIAIHNAEIGMTRITQDLAQALPVIQKIQGIWGALHADLQNIVSLIDQDIRQALPIIMNLGIEEAIVAWKNVATEANDYRTNAYISIDGNSTAPVQAVAEPAEATA
ncbi:alpha-xenorhabdolysin family binary toxin subunit A [Hymenobacter sp. CRA2]|uniref:alpha-xenorhabdolysin family binary toxin subunit A n=1 Tax=Hymenobacter sp. CRA2 TaxID=1955620 RepID=UPI00098EC7E6|nr:alpha-xenorhabdolysin family binary toxin subunit A [Hymenobacter sp. CRA2]OON68224.1 hypothetical protein B0919_13790 [Hymenobacter sp. CRA2]